MSSTTSLNGMETRSKQYSSKCNETGLELKSQLCLSPISLHRLNSAQSNLRGSKPANNCRTNLKNLAMVCSNTPNATEQLSLTSAEEQFLAWLSRLETSIHIGKFQGKSQGTLNEMTGISSKASSLISQYEEREQFLFTNQLEESFFSEAVSKKLILFAAIWTIRFFFAILASHPNVDGILVSKDPIIYFLLIGIFH